MSTNALKKAALNSIGHFRIRKPYRRVTEFEVEYGRYKGKQGGTGARTVYGNLKKGKT